MLNGSKMNEFNNNKLNMDLLHDTYKQGPNDEAKKVFYVS